VTNDQLIERVSRMRDEKALNRVINTAEARLSFINKAAREKRSAAAFTERCVGLRPGQMIYIHKEKYGSSGAFKPMFGKPIEVISTHPRLKTVDVWSYDSADKRKRYTLDAIDFENADIRSEPTNAALAWALEPRK